MKIELASLVVVAVAYAASSAPVLSRSRTGSPQLGAVRSVEGAIGPRLWEHLARRIGREDRDAGELEGIVVLGKAPQIGIAGIGVVSLVIRR